MGEAGPPCLSRRWRCSGTSFGSLAARPGPATRAIEAIASGRRSARPYVPARERPATSSRAVDGRARRGERGAQARRRRPHAGRGPGDRHRRPGSPTAPGAERARRGDRRRARVVAVRGAPRSRREPGATTRRAFASGPRAPRRRSRDRLLRTAGRRDARLVPSPQALLAARSRWARSEVVPRHGGCIRQGAVHLRAGHRSYQAVKARPDRGAASAGQTGRSLLYYAGLGGRGPRPRSSAPPPRPRRRPAGRRRLDFGQRANKHQRARWGSGATWEHDAPVLPSARGAALGGG